MLERPQNQPKLPTMQEVATLQDTDTDYENIINKAAEKYDFILDAEEYNELLQLRKKVQKFTEEHKNNEQHISELKHQLETISKQKENEINMMKNNFQQQRTALQNELTRTQQEARETNNLLKQRETELNNARHEIVSINEMFIHEQSTHKETYDQLNQIKKESSLRLQQQAEKYDGKLLESQSEINKLRNMYRQTDSYRPYSSTIKNTITTLFKDNKSPTDKDKTPSVAVRKMNN